MFRWTVIALALAATPALADDCQSPDEPISGQLSLLETLHPNGTAIKGWVLLTDEVCIRMEDFDGEMADLEPRIIHLVFSEGKEPRNLMALATDIVTARGDLMEAHTAWHLGDVVMMDAHIVEE